MVLRGCLFSKNTQTLPFDAGFMPEADLKQPPVAAQST